ncbi:hypothetical protein LguiB_002952 [Lonicera macranthoides]
MIFWWSGVNGARRKKMMKEKKIMFNYFEMFCFTIKSEICDRDYFEKLHKSFRMLKCN